VTFPGRILGDDEPQPRVRGLRPGNPIGQIPVDPRDDGNQRQRPQPDGLHELEHQGRHRGHLAAIITAPSAATTAKPNAPNAYCAVTGFFTSSVPTDEPILL